MKTVQRIGRLVAPAFLRTRLTLRLKYGVGERNLDSALRFVTLLVAITFIAIFIAYAVIRISYSYELKWMEGLMLEHVQRILMGLPLYGRPSMEFVALLYQPLYYHVLAVWSWIFGLSFESARAFSALCTIACTLIAARAVYRVSGNAQWGFLAGALYIAAYAKLGYFLDTVRLDSFFTMLIIGSCYSVIYHRLYPYRVLTIALLVAAYFTKQQAIAFIGPLLLWMIFRDRSDGFIVASSTLGPIVAIALLLEGSSNGWYSYYTVDVPSFKRSTFSLTRFIVVFFEYVGLRWSVAISVIVCSIRWFKLSDPRGLWAMMTMIGLLVGLVGIGNQGGDKNVLMQLAAFGAIAFVACLSQMRSTSTAYSLLLMQFALLAYLPFGHAVDIPGNDEAVFQEQWMDQLKKQPGEKWILFHAGLSDHTGSVNYADRTGFDDVLLGNDHVSAELRQEYLATLSSGKFALIIADGKEPIPFYTITDSVARPFVSSCGNTMIYYHRRSKEVYSPL